MSMTFVHDLNDIEDTALLICHSTRAERYVSMHEFYLILFLFTAITSYLL